MNLVQMIMDLMAGGGLGKLSSLLGESEAKTKTAVAAAVPALLSGLSNVASTGDGAQRLVSALGKVDQGSLGNLGGMMSGVTESSADQGSSMLGSILGGSALSGIAGAIAKYSGLGSGVVSKLLGYLAPLIMGMLAKQLVGKMTPQGLMGLLGGQKANIASAIPSGLSLADVPGLTSVASAAGTAYNTAGHTVRAGYETTKQASSSAAKWLVPALGLAALALVLYSFWPTTKPITSTSLRVPTVPDVAHLTKDVTGTFTSLSDTLASLKDPASITAAIPKLTELTGKLDSMKTLMDGLPETGRRQIADLINSSTGKLSDQFTRALMIPGASNSLRPALEGIVNRVSSLGGPPAGQFALPSVEVTKMGGELNSLFSSLTKTLVGVKDATSAEAALPKLTQINGQLDVTKDAWRLLPEAGKSTLSSMVKSALATLKPLVAKVLAYAGASEKVKPVVDQIMTKLTDLSI